MRIKGDGRKVNDRISGPNWRFIRKWLSLSLPLILLSCGGRHRNDDIDLIYVTEIEECEPSPVELEQGFFVCAEEWQRKHGRQLVIEGWDREPYPAHAIAQRTELPGYGAFWHYFERFRGDGRTHLVLLPSFTSGENGGLGKKPLGVVWTFSNPEWLAGAICHELEHAILEEGRE